MNTYPFSRVVLDYSDLSPELSTFTLSFHYEGHYKKYTDELNALIEKNPQLKCVPLEKLIFSRNDDIRFNAGGFYNHGIYFSRMAKGGKKPSEHMEKRISKAFGGIDGFYKQFKKAAMSIKGSGYAWLCCENGTLKIGTTVNQNTPSVDRLIPLICCDMWEHAYYLDYQNRKSEYIDAWFKLIDWEKAEDALLKIVR